MKYGAAPIRYGMTEPFVMPVANLTGFVVNGRPVKARSAFVQQLSSIYQCKHLVQYSDMPKAKASGIVTIVSADFTDAATLYLGEYEFVSNLNWTPVPMNIAASAIALAAAITATGKFVATPVGPNVIIEGDYGAGGWYVNFEARYGAVIINYSISPNDGYLNFGRPYPPGVGGILP